MANEFEAMAGVNLQELTDDELENLRKYGEMMVAGGTPSAGTRAYGIADILNRTAKLKAAERAKYGLAGLEFGENKRKFAETMGLEREKFGFEKQKAEKEMSLFEQALADTREARKKEQKNWWQKYLGTALGTGLGLVTGGWASKLLRLGTTATTAGKIGMGSPYLFGVNEPDVNKLDFYRNPLSARTLF